MEQRGAVPAPGKSTPTTPPSIFCNNFQEAGMATLSEIFQQIFQDQEVFMEYMTALPSTGKSPFSNSGAAR